MNITMDIPVMAGLASGIALVIVFSMFSVSSPNHGSREISVVVIPEGASLESNPAFLVPDVIKVKIGANNTVRWVSEDTVPHGLVSDTGYKDPVSGPLNSLEQQEQIPGGFIREGQPFEFTFTEPGEYGYHGEPHPWMQGTVIVLPP